MIEELFEQPNMYFLLQSISTAYNCHSMMIAVSRKDPTYKLILTGLNGFIRFVFLPVKHAII
jgi:hypothetical protein